MEAEGNISSTRHNNKSVARVAASDIKPADKSSSSTVARESEPEKKPRFMDHSLPPPKRSDESLSERLDSKAVTVSEISEKSNEGLKNFKFHWDLNLPIEAWSQTSDEKDEICRRDVEGEITKSVALDGLKADEASAGNGKEFQAGYDSPLEDGELKEPYPWADYKGKAEHVEYVSEDEKSFFMAGSNDSKFEESDKGILAKTRFGDASRIRKANEGNDSEKHAIVTMSNSHPKGSSSSSRSFRSKPFKVPSHDLTQRRRTDWHHKGSSSSSRSFESKPFKDFPSHDLMGRRPDNYELSSGPARRDDSSMMRMRNMSPGRGYFGSLDSKRRFSPPSYKRGSFGFERARPENMVHGRGMIINYDQSGLGSGAGPDAHGVRPDGRGPRSDGHVRKHFSDGGYKGHLRNFSDGGYKGHLRKFSDGGDRDFRGPRGDTNQFRGRMNNQMNASKRDRDSSYVSRRANYHQQESRSRSYSPVSWNSRSRSSPPSGFRAEEQFPADQEMSFKSPPTPRNRMSTLRGENNVSAESYSNRFKEPRLGQRVDVGNSMRRPSSDNNSSHHTPFIRNRRFEDPEENTGLNRFMIAQQLRTRRLEAMKNDGAEDSAFGDKNE